MKNYRLMRRCALYGWLVVFGIGLFMLGGVARADSCDPFWEDGELKCRDSGEVSPPPAAPTPMVPDIPGDSGGGSSSSCVPGYTVKNKYIPVSRTYVEEDGLYVYIWGDWRIKISDYDPGACVIMPVSVDNCTGQVIEHGVASIHGDQYGFAYQYACPSPVPPPNIDPCPGPAYEDRGNIICSSWDVLARVGPPGTTLAARPYPASLVRWENALRFDGISAPSGRGSVARAGNWWNYSITLYFQPISSTMNLVLEKIGSKTLSLGQTITYKYDVPSHPSVGGDDYAGLVGQLDEIPADMPLFRNTAFFPFRLFCRVDLDYWNNYSVVHYSRTVQIDPNKVSGLPASWKLDTNSDGIADAFGGGTTIRRMNDAGSTNDPVWRHAYSWGSQWFIAVREGQGQVGWPR